MTPIKVDDVLVLIPAFNEEKSIRNVISDVLGNGYQLLVISDGSSDNTADIARSLGVPVLKFSSNLGVGAALRAGFRYANTEGFRYVVQVDADGQHDASQIVNLVSVAKQGNFHLVIGSRFLSPETSMKISLIRRLAMWILATLASRAANTKITDASSGFRCISQPLLGEFAKNFPSSYLGDTYEALISAGLGGYRITEVAASMAPRQAGTSSASQIRAFGLTVRAALVGLLHFHVRINPYVESTSNK
jgi:glycosyltransferase involved in cell wall biosynthesis